MPPVVLAASGALTTALAASPLITTIGFGGISALSSTIVGVGLSVAASAAASALTKTESGTPGSGGSLATVNAPEVRSTVKQSTPVHRLVLGEIRTGGVITFYKSVPPYLYVQHAYSAFPAASFEQMYVAQNSVLLANGEPFELPFRTAGGALRVLVEDQLGTSLDQANNPMLDDVFGSGGTGDLDADFRLPGMPNSVYRFDYGANFDEFETLWGNVSIPDVQRVIRGCPIYDPRNPTHRLPADLRDIEDLFDAMATWSWSNNAALIQAFWAMMPFGLNAGPSKIDWDKVATAANFDDEIIGLADGTFHKRHTIDGVVTLDQTPLSVMEAMLTANRGFVSVRAGQVHVFSSQPVDARRTIADDHIIGGFTYRDRTPKRERVNTGGGTFVAPERAYQDAQGPIYTDAAALAADGEVLERAWRLPFTKAHQRFQRILKAYVKDAQLGKTITCVCDLRCLGLVEGDVVQFWSEITPELNGTYRIASWEMADDLSAVGFVLREYDATISRDWVSTEEQEFTLEVEEI